MPTPLTRRQVLVSAAASAAVAAMPAVAIAAVEEASVVVIRTPFAKFPVTPEIRAMLHAMPSADDLDVLNPYIERVRQLASPVYRAGTYPRRWIDADIEWIDVGGPHHERRFVVGSEHDDDPVADAAGLVGRSWFIASTPRNWALIDSLPQRAEVPLIEYLGLVSELGDNYERRHGDKGPRIYIAFSETGHRHFEVPHSAACGGFPERYAPEHLRLPAESA